MKYSLDTQGFRPTEFLENHIIVSKIISIKDLDETKIKAVIDDLILGLHYHNHINIKTKNTDKIVFVLTRRKEKLCVGFRNNEMQVGFDCREYTKEDLEHDNYYADVDKRILEMRKEEAKQEEA